MTKAVGVILDGVDTWHAHGVHSDYNTLCGIDADDPTIGHDGLTEHIPRGQKITCEQCWSIWRNMRALRLRESDFDPTL